MTVTNQPRRDRGARRGLPDHAMDPRRHDYHPEVVFSYREANTPVAIGWAQLEQAEAILDRRKAIAAAYEAGVGGRPAAT